MKTIKDYIDDNRDAKNVRIKINQKFTNDPADPYVEVLYDGSLSKVPEDLYPLPVVAVGTSLSTGQIVLTVHEDKNV